MMRLRLIWIALLALLTLSCSRDVLKEDPVELGICVRLPQLPDVRASVGEVSAELAAEATIKNLSIWVFLSNYFDDERPAGYCLGYLNPSQSKDPLTAYENRYYIKIDADIARAHPDVDVYVLANSGSASMNMPSSGLNQNTTRDYLKTLLLNGSYYGVKADGTPECRAVPGTGFPYSAVGKRMQMQGTYPVMNLATVTLERVVSKFRFVVSQLTDAVGPVMDFSIDELTLDGNQFASSEYIFNDGYLPWKFVKNGNLLDYISTPVRFTVPDHDAVALNPAPEEYAYAPGQTGQEYENRILQGIRDGVLTDVGVCYLRESDKAVGGHITYTVGGVQTTRTFHMEDGAALSRNHSWIVYIYFLRDEMRFSVTWTDWVHGRDYDWSTE